MRLLGVRSIRVFPKNMGDLYYEPTIVVHDNMIACSYSNLMTDKSFEISSKTAVEKGHVQVKQID